MGVTHELLKVVHILMRRVRKMAAQMQGMIIGISLSEKIGRNLRRDICTCGNWDESQKIKHIAYICIFMLNTIVEPWSFGSSIIHHLEKH